jgi:hypothetical protein
VTGLMPLRSWPLRDQCVGEAAKQIVLRASCRKGETDAAGYLDDTGCDFEKPEPNRGELGDRPLGDIVVPGLRQRLAGPPSARRRTGGSAPHRADADCPPIFERLAARSRHAGAYRRCRDTVGDAGGEAQQPTKLPRARRECDVSGRCPGFVTTAAFRGRALVPLSMVLIDLG